MDRQTTAEASTPAALEAPVSTARRRPTARMQSKRARTREQVLEAAERMYIRAGGQPPSRMEDLADAAEVSIGLIYNYFGGKDGVDLALAERALAGLAADLRDADHEGYPLVQQVIVIGGLYLRWIREHPSVLRSVVLQGVDAPVGAMDRIDTGIGIPLQEILLQLQERIEHAMAGGEADDTLDPRLIAVFLWTSWNGIAALMARTDRMAFSSEDVAECLHIGTRLINRGLTPPSRQRDRPPSVTET